MFAGAGEASEAFSPAEFDAGSEVVVVGSTGDIGRSVESASPGSVTGGAVVFAGGVTSLHPAIKRPAPKTNNQLSFVMAISLRFVLHFQFIRRSIPN